jgi:hypothetical protein
MTISVMPQKPGLGVKPKFGFVPAPALLTAMDFATLGASTVAQNKLIYGMVIGSRVVAARENTERWENLRRDPLGWYSWFMGSPLLQVGLALFGLPLVAKGSKELMVNHLNKDANFIQKLGWTLFNPSKLWLLASDKQLEQRKTQLVDGLLKAGRQKEIEAVEKLFSKTIVMRGLMSFIGLAFTIALLGVFINLLNIAMTKASLRKTSAKSEFQPTGGRFAANPQPGLRTPVAPPQNVFAGNTPRYGNPFIQPPMVLPQQTPGITSYPRYY